MVSVTEISAAFIQRVAVGPGELELLMIPATLPSRPRYVMVPQFWQSVISPELWPQIPPMRALWPTAWISPIWMHPVMVMRSAMPTIPPRSGPENGEPGWVEIMSPAIQQFSTRASSPEARPTMPPMAQEEKLKEPEGAAS